MSVQTVSSRAADVLDAKATRFVYASLLLLFTYVFLANAWMGDDAYITFRTVWNFVHGYGIVFNRLFTLANMPIKRFGSMLAIKGELDRYLDLLDVLRVDLYRLDPPRGHAVVLDNRAFPETADRAAEKDVITSVLRRQLGAADP